MINVTNDTSLQSSGSLPRYVLLLGGAGFIGTRLAKLLTEKSIPLRIGDKSESTGCGQFWTKCDVTQRESLTGLARGTDAIVNLAAEHRDDVLPLSRYHEVNVGGAAKVCDLARESGVNKIVFTSSVAVYGFQSHAVDEGGPFEPFNEYGKTKLQAEAIYRAWAEENSLRTLVIIRPTVVFGEGNRGNVYNLLRQIATGRFFMVGSGENIKSIAYVGNVAAFLAHALTMGPGVHISNYVDGPDMTTHDLVTHIYQCLGMHVRIRRVPKAFAMACGHALDIASRISGRKFPISAIRVRKFSETTQFKANRVPQWGFRPPYTLVEGLARTVKSEFGNQ